MNQPQKDLYTSRTIEQTSREQRLLNQLSMSRNDFVNAVQRVQPFDSEGSCRIVANDLLCIQDQLIPALKEWLKTGVLPELGPIEGITANGLQAGIYDNKPLRATGALLMLDLLLVAPEEAKELLSRPTSGFRPTPGPHPLPPLRPKEG